ncbi:NAD(P)/FAD-dependent oxidoreductase [Microbulbifer sp. THAF38]|uniref:NAD(P)/FAD-dependent oxidoreductase n=1 Tax=Microbulbifer sp. THAF38 TaxID=2587856 RepID=UPI001268FDC9|nr:NAD(P)/FAD-dependent oxidoreductase [Microbulbifer sp. THAF38]QFT53677.1 L-2-hydroxyglutarate oxidase LhgO [Microbulbifer sp. THAF38]
MEMLDTVIVGAGVLGLACAYQLSRAGHKVMVLEQHSAIGTETSARNSEVIHAGIYYPTGSLKARACVKGKSMLYQFCQKYAVPHKQIGKLVVATDKAQLPQLRALKAQGDANSAGGLRLLNTKEALSMEPELQCAGAIYSPTTGIIDSHSLVLALEGATESKGGEVILASKVVRIEISSGTCQLVMKDGYRLTVRNLILAAGLHTSSLMSTVNSEVIKREIPTTYFVKGSYFTQSSKVPFSHLIYPLPEGAGLGIHLTLDLTGGARFGPDVEWIKTINYQVDPGKRDKFYSSIQSYWPGLESNTLQPGYAGIRPKIVPQGVPAGDFQVLHKRLSNNTQLIAFFGIESPGLTSSLYLGEMISKITS